METLIASIVLAISTNLDNLAVGVAYGIKQVKIDLKANLAIALLSGLSTFMAMSLGDRIAQILPPILARATGSTLLILIGLLATWEVYRRQSQDLSPEQPSQTQPWLADNDRTPQRMTLLQAVMLGIALTLTNFSTGLAAGMAQLDLVLTSGLSSFSSLLTIGGGVFLGAIATTQIPQHRLEWASGLLLIGLGLSEYWLA